MHHIPVVFAALFLIFVLFLVGVMAVSLYFLPTVIAHGRHTKYRWFVTMLNLLFGLTIVGWFMCMVMAIIDTQVD